MAHDVSFTAYKAREKENPKAGEYRKPDKEKMHDAYLKWKLRKAQGAFDLKKFLGDGKKKEAESGDRK